jgi:hypothetical protein
MLHLHDLNTQILYSWMTLNAVEKEPKFAGSGIYKVCRDGMLEIDEGIDPSKLLLLSFLSSPITRRLSIKSPTLSLSSHLSFIQQQTPTLSYQ